ncbi:cystathionine gamma-synthase [Candidatus Tachikawaea gelatinosa]|uniref:Cystathionine gamma-synthase n=1 Tax=Candidatus Tachikawaea gelatinosa TaxID=1410383 RepID=A0A090BWG9_9ENTR|nr:cystathionine gamma-synthase [Candidatus Tachikawaea gelatinosa]BAP58586.1 cystathionine gamma-synthase [Candidatus Tachikawaea gelatinosa]
MKKNTIVVHSGLNIDRQYGSVVHPIYLSTTYNFLEFNQPRLHDYSRRSNPTRDIAQNLLAELEEGVGAILTNSGMSAIYLLTTMFLSTQDLIIAPYDCYGGTYRLLKSLHDKKNFTVKFIDQNNMNQIKKSFNQKPKLILIESPSNPLLRVVNLSKICNLAKSMNIISVVDNTFLSPILQNPLKLGADLVLHSCTKYLNGHSDIVAGAIIAKDIEIFNELSWWANNIGVTNSAFDSYLLTRGLRTLSLRIDIAQTNTLKIIEYIKKKSIVKKIYHPSLSDNIGHKYALIQQKGFGSMLSFEINSSMKNIIIFLKSLTLFTLAESLGGVESLVAHPATMTHASISKEVRIKSGISNQLIRLSIGIENYKDLINDLENAFKKI